MKNFKFDLNAKVAIYVPSTTNVNEPTDNTAIVNDVMTAFSKWFGGCTSTPAVGGWVSNSGALVVENVTIVYAFCTPESFGKHFEEVYALAAEIRDEMKQEAVTLEYNGQIKFV